MEASLRVGASRDPLTYPTYRIWIPIVAVGKRRVRSRAVKAKDGRVFAQAYKANTRCHVMAMNVR